MNTDKRKKAPINNIKRKIKKNAPVNNIKRKIKKHVPDCDKDYNYYAYRELNTLRASKSRQKKKEADIEFKKIFTEAEETNKELKKEIVGLEAQLDILISLYKMNYYAYNHNLFNDSIIINNLIL